MNYALHETIELHEVSAFKAVCMTKSKTMQLLVSDPDLKDLLQADVEMSTRQLQELRGLMANVAPREGQA